VSTPPQPLIFLKKIKWAFVLLIVMGVCVINVHAKPPNWMKLVPRSIVFIYDSNARPCDPPPPGKFLLPLGSGFIVGIRAKEGSESEGRVWKFLVTAQHVIDGRSSVIFRMNSQDESRLVCYTHKLSRSGNTRNVFLSKRPEVDLLLTHMPDIPDTAPIVFDYSTIADDMTYEKLEIGVGTEVFTIGYLYGYSGKKQNYPVTKFGKVALLTDEKWYRSKKRNIDEYAYLIELSTTRGLSGAPVILKSPQFRGTETGGFEIRGLGPTVIGVIKGLLKFPIAPKVVTSQGVAAIEPARHIKEVLREIADELVKAGHTVNIPSAAQGPQQQ